MTRAALLLPPLLLTLSAKAADACFEDVLQQIKDAPPSRHVQALANESRVKRGLARIGFQLAGNIQDDGLPEMANLDQGISNLADALEGVPGTSLRGKTAAQVVVSSKTSTQARDDGIRLLVQHDAPKDALNRDIPIVFLKWRIKRRLPALQHIQRDTSLDPDSYLDGLKAFSTALEAGRMNDDLLKKITKITVTDEKRVTASDPRLGRTDGDLESVALRVPAGALDDPAPLKTAALEAWTEGLLGRFGHGGRRPGGTIVNGGLDQQAYDNTLKGLIEELSNALRREDPLDMSRLGRIHFEPPGTEARAAPATADGDSTINVHVPVDMMITTPRAAIEPPTVYYITRDTRSLLLTVDRLLSSRLDSALANEDRVWREFERLNILMTWGIEKHTDLKITNFDRGIATLADTLEGIRDTPRWDTTSIRVVISNYNDVQKVRNNGIDLLVRHSTEDRLGWKNDLEHYLQEYLFPRLLTQVHFRKKLPNLKWVRYQFPVFYTEAYSTSMETPTTLDSMARFLKALESEGVAGDDLLQQVSTVRLTNGRRVRGRWRNQLLVLLGEDPPKGIHLDVPVGAKAPDDFVPSLSRTLDSLRSQSALARGVDWSSSRGP